MSSNFNNKGSRGERRKNAFFRYFELLISKFSKLVYHNVVYFLCIFPLLSGLIIFSLNLFGVSEEVVDSIPIIQNILKITGAIPPTIAFILFIISALIYGPLTAGLTYVIRNFVNGKHAWFTEMFTRAKENFKQGLLLGIVDILVLTSFLMYMALDVSALDKAMRFYYGFMRLASYVVFFIYIFMRHYLFTLAVTFELKLAAIFKNAAIFAVLGVINNTLATFVIFLIIWSFTSTPFIDAVLIISLIFSLSIYTSLFATYPIVKKYMLNENMKVKADEQK